MSYDVKLSDLKFKIPSLLSKETCDYFISFSESNLNLQEKEKSYKFNSKKIQYDNYKCISLSKVKNTHSKPFELAYKYINIMVLNYVMYIQNNICPSFDDTRLKLTDNIRILKYEKGTCIKDHIDVSGYIRGSCTLNLNEDYKGGEFRFFNGQEKLSLKTGDGLFFPAEPIWIHGTEPIIEGTRYSINCFLQ